MSYIALDTNGHKPDDKGAVDLGPLANLRLLGHESTYEAAAALCKEGDQVVIDLSTGERRWPVLEAREATPPEAPVKVEPVADDQPVPAGWCEVWRGEIGKEDVGRTGYDFFSSKNTAWHAHRFDSKVIKGFMPGGDRLSIGRAPDGTPALEELIPDGAVVNFSAYCEVLPPGTTHALFEGSIWIPAGFRFPPNGGQKLGLVGMVIGGECGHVGGGSAKTIQTGIAVRNVHTLKSGFKGYGYWLNRAGDKQGANEFGGYSDKASGEIPYGRWVCMGIEVQMDRPGKMDGWLKWSIDGKVFGAADRLDLGASKGWYPKFLLLNSMFGGDEQEDRNQNKFDVQHLWTGKQRVLVPN